MASGHLCKIVWNPYNSLEIFVLLNSCKLLTINLINTKFWDFAVYSVVFLSMYYPGPQDMKVGNNQTVYNNSSTHDYSIDN